MIFVKSLALTINQWPQLGLHGQKTLMPPLKKVIKKNWIIHKRYLLSYFFFFCNGFIQNIAKNVVYIQVSISKNVLEKNSKHNVSTIFYLINVFLVLLLDETKFCTIQFFTLNFEMYNLPVKPNFVKNCFANAMIHFLQMSHCYNWPLSCAEEHSDEFQLFSDYLSSNTRI